MTVEEGGGGGGRWVRRNVESALTNGRVPGDIIPLQGLLKHL